MKLYLVIIISILISGCGYWYPVQSSNGCPAFLITDKPLDLENTYCKERGHIVDWHQNYINYQSGIKDVSDKSFYIKKVFWHDAGTCERCGKYVTRNDSVTVDTVIVWKKSGENKNPYGVKIVPLDEDKK